MCKEEKTHESDVLLDVSLCSVPSLTKQTGPIRKLRGSLVTADFVQLENCKKQDVALILPHPRHFQQ
jgi:hypothetical protein